MNTIRFKKKITPYLLLTPALITILLIVIFPVAYTLRLSFFKYDMLKTSVPVFVGLKNYVSIFKDANFYNSLGITAIYIGATIPLQFIIGFGLALILNSERIRGMRFLSTILLSPIVIAPVAIGTTWQMLFRTEIGVINGILSLFIRNFTPPVWLADIRFALPAVMIVDIWQKVPFFMLILLAGLKSMPEEPFESAMVDGASRVQCFRYLTLPLLKGPILIAFVFMTIESFREFDKVFMLTKGGPAGGTEVLSLFVYNEAFKSYHIGYASALSILMMIMAGFIAWSFIRAIKLKL